MTPVDIHQLVFKYHHADPATVQIDRLQVASNDHLFIEGPSGSGKTTLLNLMTGLLRPTHGHINIFGTNMSGLSASAADRLRADYFGIIFQWFNLIPYLSVIENIILPGTFSKKKQDRVAQRGVSLVDEARSLCADLNIDDRYLDWPIESLSMGQQQRIAIARALIGSPNIIIADEPTSALDDANTTLFMDRLLTQCRKHGSTLIFVSHDASLKSYFNRVYTMESRTVS